MVLIELIMLFIYIYLYFIYIFIYLLLILIYIIFCSCCCNYTLNVRIYLCFIWFIYCFDVYNLPSLYNCVCKSGCY